MKENENHKKIPAWSGEGGEDMKTTNKFVNLRIEMAKRNLGIRDIAEAMGVERSTASRKLSGKGKFTLCEAVNISEKLFDGLDLKYLFSL